MRVISMVRKNVVTFDEMMQEVRQYIKKEENIDVIKNTIIKKIDNDFNFVNKVYDFYKLISYKTR